MLAKDYSSIPENGDALRTRETLIRYTDAADPNFMDTAQGTPLGEHWQIFPNEFPYDKLAERHDLLFPRRKFAEPEDMNREEAQELALIQKDFAGDYDSILMNLPHTRSVPGYFHLHLLRFHYRIPPIKHHG